MLCPEDASQLVGVDILLGYIVDDVKKVSQGSVCRSKRKWRNAIEYEEVFSTTGQQDYLFYHKSLADRQVRYTDGSSWHWSHSHMFL